MGTLTPGRAKIPDSQLLLSFSSLSKEETGALEGGCRCHTLGCRSFLCLRVEAGAPLQSLNPDPFPCFQIEVGTLQAWLERREITMENGRSQRPRSDVQLSPFYLRKRALFQLLSNLVC